MKILIRALFLSLLIIMPPLHSEAADGEVAGQVTRLQNAAMAIQDALPRVLSVGSEILVGDVISTGKNARIEIRMLDDSVMTLGARTNFVVVDFVFQPNEGNAAFRLLEGAFKAASGELVKVADANFIVDTPTATIGIRGTEFWGGSLAGDFEVALLSGKGVYVETKKGRVDLTTVGEGTKAIDINQPPSQPKIWGETKVKQALATITFE